MGSVTILVIPHTCLSVLLQDDITEAITCAKKVVSDLEGIRAWYVGILKGGKLLVLLIYAVSLSKAHYELYKYSWGFYLHRYSK